MDYEPHRLDQRELVAAISEVLWVAGIAIRRRDDALLEQAWSELGPLVAEYQRRAIH